MQLESIVDAMLYMSCSFLGRSLKHLRSRQISAPVLLSVCRALLPPRLVVRRGHKNTYLQNAPTFCKLFVSEHTIISLTHNIFSSPPSTCRRSSRRRAARRRRRRLCHTPPLPAAATSLATAANSLATAARRTPPPPPRTPSPTTTVRPPGHGLFHRL